MSAGALRPSLWFATLRARQAKSDHRATRRTGCRRSSTASRLPALCQQVEAAPLRAGSTRDEKRVGPAVRISLPPGKSPLRTCCCRASEPSADGSAPASTPNVDDLIPDLAVISEGRERMLGATDRARHEVGELGASGQSPAKKLSMIRRQVPLRSHLRASEPVFCCSGSSSRSERPNCY